MNNILKGQRFSISLLLTIAFIVAAIGFFITPPSNVEAANDRYWVGGTGTWSQTSHWSTSDGGAGGASVPGSTNDVHFTANSDSGSAFIVTIGAASYCGDILWDGIDQIAELKFGGSYTLNIYGSIGFDSNMSITGTSGTLYLQATTSETITTEGIDIPRPVYFAGAGGTWTLQDSFTSTYSGGVNHTGSGSTLDTNDQAVNVVGYLCSGGNTILDLGSSVITVSGGSIAWSWNAEGVATLTAGTSSIVLQDSRAFLGGDLTYYDVDITAQGITTANLDWESTLTGANSFHDLTLRNNTEWDYFVLDDNQVVTGTFTAVGDGALDRLWITSDSTTVPRSINAAAVSSTYTDYHLITGLGAGSWDISAGEDNSIDLGGNTNITFTDDGSSAVADLYWIGDAGDQYDMYHWSLTSGGGDPVRHWLPTATNNVIFDANSFTMPGQTVTNASSLSTFECNDFDFSAVLFSPTIDSSTRYVYGDITFISAMTLSGGSHHIVGSADTTITSGGQVFTIYFDKATNAASMTQLDALVLSGQNWLIQGTWNTGNFNVTIPTPSTSTSTSRFTWNLGSSTVTSSWWMMTSGTYTINAGTSTINYTGTTHDFGTTEQTYYNLNLLGAGSPTISSGCTFNNLTRIGTNVFTDGLKFGGDMVVQGTLTLTGYDSAHRLQFMSSVSGTQRQVTINTLNAITNVDIKDSAAVGTASPDISAGNNSDLGNNLGWIFTTGQYCYWVGNSGNWSDITHWATSSGGAGGGAGSRVPLIQDMAVFDENSFQITGRTVTIDVTNLSGIDSSDVTNYPTVTKAGQVDIYGAVNMGHMVFSPTTTYFKGKTSVVVLQGTDPIVSNVIIQKDASIMASVTMGSNFTISGSLTLSSGNFNLGSYTLTMASFDSSTTTYLRSLYLGSGIMILNSTGAINKWNIATSNFTLQCGTSTIAITNSGASAQSLTPGAGLTYYNLTITGAGTYTTTFNSTGIWNTWYIDRSTSAKNIAGNFAQTFQTLAIPPNGVVTVGIANVDFVKAAGTVVCDYLNFTGGNNTSTASGGATFYAGSHSGGSPQTGWNFTDPDMPTITTQAATNVSSVAATLNGNLTAMGGYGTVYVYFHYDNAGTFVSYSSTTPKETKTGTGAYYYGLTGLSDSYNYYYRAVASDGYVDLAYGATVHFIASGILPTPGENPYVHGGFVPSVGNPDVVYHTPGAISGFVENPAQVTTLPAYALFKRAADEMGWTTNVLYAIFGLFIVICLGVGAGILTGSALLAVAAMLLTAAALISTTILGWWVLIILGILLIGYLAVAKSF